MALATIGTWEDRDLGGSHDGHAWATIKGIMQTKEGMD